MRACTRAGPPGALPHGAPHRGWAVGGGCPPRGDDVPGGRRHETAARGVGEAHPARGACGDPDGPGCRSGPTCPGFGTCDEALRQGGAVANARGGLCARRDSLGRRGRRGVAGRLPMLRPLRRSACRGGAWGAWRFLRHMGGGSFQRRVVQRLPPSLAGASAHVVHHRARPDPGAGARRHRASMDEGARRARVHGLARCGRRFVAGAFGARGHADRRGFCFPLQLAPPAHPRGARQSRPHDYGPDAAE